MAKTFSRKIALYSFAMSVVIVIYHMALFDIYPIEFVNLFDKIFYETIYEVLENSADIALGYFFTISAFLFYRTASQENLQSKIKGRIYSLGVPFVLWNVLAWIFFTLKEFEPYLPNGPILSFTFAPFMGPLWYMFVLIVYVLLSPLLMRLQSLNPKAQIFIYFILLVITMVLSIYLGQGSEAQFADLWWLERIIRYIPAYYLGIVVAWNGDKIYMERYNKRLVSVIAIAIFILSEVYIVMGAWMELNRVVTYLILRIQPILVWFMFHCNSEEKVEYFPLKISFFVYAMHELCIVALGIITYRLSNLMVWTGYQLVILRCLSTLLVYIVILITAKVIKAGSPKVYGWLSGGRT